MQIYEDGKQFAKCRKAFVNYFEYLGKLLQSGKAWESFLSFVYQERFQKQQERFCQSLSKSGKAFKNSGKGFFPKFPKITLGKERERKAFSPSENRCKPFPPFILDFIKWHVLTCNSYSQVRNSYVLITRQGHFSLLMNSYLGY